MQNMQICNHGTANIFVISIKCTPRPWTAPKMGRKGAYSTHTRFKKYLRSLIAANYRGPLITSQCRCDLLFCMPVPKSAPKYVRAKMLAGIINPATTPDRTNLAKITEDAMEGIVLSNDKLIVGGFVDEIYSETPEIIIRMRIL